MGQAVCRGLAPRTLRTQSVLPRFLTGPSGRYALVAYDTNLRFIGGAQIRFAFQANEQLLWKSPPHVFAARCYHSILMAKEEHPSADELETYALGSCSNADLEKVEEHLFICERCQDELALTDHYIQAMKGAAAAPEIGKRLRSIHTTEDGPIFGAIHCGADGKWIARHWGGQLDGRRICDSVEEANAYLMESFWQMFPEHVCSEWCREELQ
jgi:hypothetical protein